MMPGGRRFRTIAVIVVVLSLLWISRAEVAIGVVGTTIEWMRDVGPHHEVEWERGPEVAIRSPSERPPNIVLILADDMGWNDVSTQGGGAGAGSVKTPHIDSLAREGANFTTGYAANGTCAPSRAAILSGRYGTRFGFEFTPTPASMMPIMAVVMSASPVKRRPGLVSSFVGGRRGARPPCPVAHRRGSAVRWGPPPGRTARAGAGS